MATSVTVTVGDHQVIVVKRHIEVHNMPDEEIRLQTVGDAQTFEASSDVCLMIVETAEARIEALTPSTGE